MDIDETLRLFREAVADYRAAHDLLEAATDAETEMAHQEKVNDAAERMAEYGAALDEHIMRGGFLPIDWR